MKSELLRLGLLFFPAEYSQSSCSVKTKWPSGEPLSTRICGGVWKQRTGV